MEVLSVLLEVSIYSVVLFLAVIAVKNILKNKMSPGLHFAVWFIIIARLCLPVTLDSSIKFFTVPIQASALDASVTSDSPMQPNSDYMSSDTGSLGVKSAHSETVTDNTYSVSNQTGSTVQKTTSISWTTLLIAAWLTGLLLIVLWMTVSAVKMNRVIRRKEHTLDTRIHEIFNTCKAEMNIRKNIPVVMLPGITTPALTIGLKPKMILPEDIISDLRDERIAFAIKHELMHYKRKDNLLCILLRILEAVYWFNPVIWIMNRCMITDMETACDSMVVKNLEKQEKKQYALTLIELFSQERTPQLLLGMALNNTEKIAEKRIKGVFMKNRSKAGVKITTLILAAVMFVCCFTTACQPMLEKQVVAGKGDSSLKSAIAVKAAPESAALQTAETGRITNMSVSGHWTDSTASKLTTVTIDADVLTPNVTTYPVYKVSPIVVDKALAEKFVKYVSKDAVEIKNSSALSLDELEDSIQRLQNELSRVKAGTLDLDNELSQEEEMKNVEDELEAYEKEYSRIAILGDTTGDPLDYTFNPYPGNNNDHTLSFSAEMKNGSTMQLDFKVYDCGGISYSEVSFHNSKTSDNKKGNPASSEEAKAAALEVINELGIGDFDLDSESIEGSYNCLVFSRVFSGIPVTYTNFGEGNPNFVNEKKVMNHFRISQERLAILVNDTGDINIEWYSPCNVISKLSENVELMPLKGIEEIFKQQIMNNINVDDSTKETVLISEVRLGYMAISGEDDYYSYRLVPVWDFIGHNETNPEQTKTNESGIEIEDISYMTINAIDGNIIYRKLGY